MWPCWSRSHRRRTSCCPADSRLLRAEPQNRSPLRTARVSRSGDPRSRKQHPSQHQSPCPRSSQS
ncbi:hypothetical protein T484DRAFT_1988987, partial [Baffinella frigidus]